MTFITIKTDVTMELIDITREVAGKLSETGMSDGICFLFNPHTTAALTINEGADPNVRTDIIQGLKEMVPMNYPFRHMEGNSPAHIMSSLVGASASVAVTDGELQLGTWQKIFFCEFDGPRTRKVHLHFLSNPK